jgi:polyisoprenoid-binding protein YceI
MVSLPALIEKTEREALDGGESVFLVDSVRSRVGFSVRHVAGRVHGAFSHASGVIHYDPRKPEATAARVSIQASSVLTHNDVRDLRLRSSGFLDVRSFPEITFVSTAARRVGHKLEVTGELTLRGVSRPVTLTVGRLRKTATAAAALVRVSALVRGTLRRLDFGVGPSSELELGGLLIGDEIAVDIELELELELARKISAPRALG